MLRITERGFPGHFIASRSCTFRRNTLIEVGDDRVVVSTVGNYRPDHRSGEVEVIGAGDRYYETMAFKAIKEGVYWEADVSEQVDFSSPWSINQITEESDFAADVMHDTIVKEISERMQP